MNAASAHQPHLTFVALSADSGAVVVGWRSVRYRQLRAAGRSGKVIGGADGVAVDAELIRRCCTEDAASVDPRGLRFRGVHIRGSLDLAGVAVAFPLRFDECLFDDAVRLENAQLPALTITGARSLPGLLGNGLQIRGDLDLSRSHISGAHRTSASTTKHASVWLCESQVGGRLLCVDTVFDTSGERAIQADRIRVGGTVRLLHGFTSNAEIRLIGAQIDGSLDLTGVHISCPGGLALDLDGADVRGSIFIIPHQSTGRRPTISGRLDMGNARIGGQLLVRDAIFEGRSPVPVAGPYGPNRTVGTALNAPRLTVSGDVTFQGACRFDGGLDLALSDLGSLTAHGDCRFMAAGQGAIDLSNAELRSSVTFSPGVVVQGNVRFTGARVHGNLSMQGITLDAARNGALVSAAGVSVDGDVELQRLTATGGYVRFRSAAINGAVDAGGATLVNPDGQTLALHQCTIGGSVRLVDGFHSTGSVLLNRSTINGRLDLRHGTFTCPEPSERNPAGHAIEAIATTAQGGFYLGWQSAGPSVDFTNATTTILADDPDRWPPAFVVSGLTYDRFEQVIWDRRKRCDWLARQATYDAGPYEQLAKVFRQHGYTSDAEAIQIEQRHAARRANRRQLRPLRRALDAGYGWTVGYGLRPGRVFWLLLILLILVSASLQFPGTRAAMRATDERGNVYTTDGRLVTVDVAEAPTSTTPGDYTRRATEVPRADRCGEGQIRCFNPILYAVDTVVPLISLGQRSTWYANAATPAGQAVDWWLNIATLFGWLLSTIFLLSFTRFGRTT